MPVGAGVLLVCEDRVLLGKELDGWSGFGGRCELRETGVQAAARETEEETAGIVSAPWIVAQERTCFESHTPSGGVFLLYLIFVPERIDVREFVHRRGAAVSAACREKTELRWVKLAHVARLRLRHGFQRDWECIRMAIECTLCRRDATTPT